MHPELDAALAWIDQTFAGAWIRPVGRIALYPGTTEIAASVTAAISAHRSETMRLLRPIPHRIRFVADNLDVWDVPFNLAKTTTTIHYGKRPYHRLTPKLWFQLNHAVGRLPRNDPNRAAADSILAELSGWVELHYRPDQIQRAEHATCTQAGKTRPIQAA